MKCNYDCFNCKYSDCIANEATVAEMKQQKEYEKELARKKELESENIDYRRRWELKNYERARENKRRWYEQNKERIKAKKKKYYEENKERLLEQQKQHKKKEKEYYNAVVREYKRKNRAKAAEKAAT